MNKTSKNATKNATKNELIEDSADAVDEYVSILQKALHSNNIDEITARLSKEKVRNDLDIITKNVSNSKSWSTLKATIVSIVAKLKYPDWDTRYHQTQIGGKFSLRSIDACHVSKFLYTQGLYDTITAFALTRSFEKAEPFNKTYSGKISPVECKTAFLNIMEIINSAGSTGELLNDILVYLLSFLKARKEKTTTLKNSIVLSTTSIGILEISKMLDEINGIGSGSSVVPVIIVHTLLSLVQPYLWKDVSIKPLKEHTASDSHSQSYGDIEGFRGGGGAEKPVIAVEIKHKIAITDSIITVFDRKTGDISLKYILTTANTKKRIVSNNICIDTVSSFVQSVLQLALFHEPNICLMFAKELRSNIIEYKNIGVSIKEAAAAIITTLLVSPST